MRELKDLHTCCREGIVDPVLQGVAHGLRQQLDLVSLDSMSEELHSLLLRACEACEPGSSETDTEQA